ncbi:MAG: MYXO-CTERM sorting domain-containing protein [Pseudomonadota bacterium]
MKPSILPLFLTGLLSLPGLALAGPILYQADLTAGESVAGTVANDSIGALDRFSYWRFEANAGDRIDVTVLRSERDHDPVMWIWFGLFSDTTELGRAQFFADDEIAALGPYGDPREQFTAQAGVYTVGVFDHSAARTRCDGLCDFQITVTGSSASVPEPPAVTMLALGLLSLSVLRARRRRSLADANGNFVAI